MNRPAASTRHMCCTWSYAVMPTKLLTRWHTISAFCNNELDAKIPRVRSMLVIISTLMSHIMVILTLL
jgi:hypothetical protein